MSDTGGTSDAASKVREHLWDACEIEQQLMIQYLFAAFTLKNHPDESCTPAEWEAVRRWGSAVFTVARQEMEHLALANGILTAIAQDPFFGRENIPLQSRYFLGGERARDHSPRRLAAGAVNADAPQPCDLPFVFERFNRQTIERFVCAESPDWEDLIKEGVPTADWCFSQPGRPCRATTLEEWASGVRSEANGGLGLGRTHVAGGGAAAAVPPEQGPIHPGSIQELYARIDRELHRNPGLFTGNPAQQVYVPVEYQINITPVTDVASAHLAIKLIVEEGEGIDAPPGFQSHYLRFHAVRDELLQLQKQAKAAGRRFDPSLPVVLNPSAAQIHSRFTREVFDLFNHAYTTLLFVLTSLYRNFNANESSYPFLSQSLQIMAFGPFMTMILRPVAEVLVELKLERGGRETAGPNFHFLPEDELIIWPRPPAPPPAGSHATPDERRRLSAKLDDIEFILGRLEELVERLAALSSERELGAELLHAGHEEWARRKLAFVHESAQAMANSIRRVYQVGQLPAFVLSPG